MFAFLQAIEIRAREILTEAVEGEDFRREFPEMTQADRAASVEAMLADSRTSITTQLCNATLLRRAGTSDEELRHRHSLNCGCLLGNESRTCLIPIR